MRALFPEGSFIEVFVDCPVEETERRDPKGLYKKAKQGAVGSFTGVSGGYQPPVSPELVVKTAEGDSPEESARAVLRFVGTRIVL